MALQMYAARTKILAIAGGKGGVGKSTVTVLLALALRDRGKRVGVLDADVYGPSLRRMLPEEQLPQLDGERIVPAMAQGIKTISIAHYRPAGQANAIRGPIAHGIVKQFINQVDWGELDYLLVDFPPGTGDVPMSLCQELDLTGAILVTTPQEIALLDVRKAAAFFQQMEVRIAGVVENMSYLAGQPELRPFGQGGGEALAKQLGVPLLAQLPLDPELGQQCDRGEVVSLATMDAVTANV